MATNSTSSRPLSMAARSTRRPIRPNPLMATFTAMISSLSLPVRDYGSAEPFAHGLGDGFRRDAEMPEQILGRRRGAEAGHADEDPLRSQPAFPAEADRGLDADAQGVAQHFFLVADILRRE